MANNERLSGQSQSRLEAEAFILNEIGYSVLAAQSLKYRFGIPVSPDEMKAAIQGTLLASTYLGAVGLPVVPRVKNTEQALADITMNNNLRPLARPELPYHITSGIFFQNYTPAQMEEFFENSVRMVLVSGSPVEPIHAPVSGHYALEVAGSYFLEFRTLAPNAKGFLRFSFAPITPDFVRDVNVAVNLYSSNEGLRRYLQAQRRAGQYELPGDQV